MNKNILDRKFRHHMWFKGSNLTKRQAIEYFASEGGFYLIEKPSKVQSNNLFDPIQYDTILKSEERGTYKLTGKELEYYLQRKEFWKQFKVRIENEWNNWGKDADYTKWLDYKYNQKILVKEYAEYDKAYRESA